MPNRQLLHLLVVLTIVVPLVGTMAGATPPTSDELSQAVEQLSSPRFEQRRKATLLLWSAGAEARPLLEAAATSKNAEVRLRARAVLDQFRYGIFSTTPPRDIELIQRFREGDLREQAEVLKQLADRGAIASVLRLLAVDGNKHLEAAVRPKLVGYLEEYGETGEMLRLATEATSPPLRAEFIRIALTRYEKEENFAAMVRQGSSHVSPEVRRGIRTWVEKAAPRFLPTLFDQADFAMVENLLELGAVGDLGMRHLAVYASQQGGLEQRIEQLRERAAAGDNADPEVTRLLATLLRANGQLAAAQRVAEQLGDAGTELQRTLLYELADWPNAIEFNRVHPPPGNFDWAMTETLGYQAAYQRLAGDEAGYQQTIAELVDLSSRDLQLGRTCAKALLIHGETARAFEIKQVENPAEAFELMCQQFRYADAFRLAEIGDTEELRNAWFTKVAHDAKIHAELSQQRLTIGLHAARVLAAAGYRNEAQAAFEKFGTAVSSDGYITRIQAVCDAELKSGFHDLAFQHATSIVGKNRSILATMFPKHHQTAETLWDYFRHVDRNETYVVTMGRIRYLLYRSPSRTEPPVDLAKLVESIERLAADLSPAKETRWLIGAGRTSELWGRRDLAKRCFQQAATRHADAAFRYADQFVADQDWLAAAHWYRTSWELDHRRSGAMFLQGKMLFNAGRQREGERLMELARLMPLADAQNRYQYLAGPLKSHQLIDEAIEEWKRIVQHGRWSEEEVLSAVREIGNAVEGQDLLAAADYWEKMLLACLQLKFSFTQAGGYIQIPHLVHKTRARGLLAAGQLDDALTEIELAHAICPGDSDFIERIVPELEESGHPELADRLFDRTYEIMADSCRLFAHSARYRNDLAWMSARCNRRLDEALRLVQEALEFAPRNASYIDTLGEVHFRRGEIAAAIAAAERCLEIEPGKAVFQKQLDRFRAAQ